MKSDTTNTGLPGCLRHAFLHRVVLPCRFTIQTREGLTQSTEHDIDSSPLYRRSSKFRGQS